MRKLFEEFINTNTVFSIDILNIKNNELDNVFTKFLFMINKNDKKQINVKYDRLIAITDFPSKFETNLNKNVQLTNEEFYELLMRQIFNSKSIKSSVVIRFLNNTRRFEFNVEEINDIYVRDKKKINKIDKLKIQNYENDKLKLIRLLNNILKLED